MQNNSEKRLEEVAVFRYGLIADALHLPRGSAEIGHLLRSKAERTHAIPHSNRVILAAETMRHWLKLYRKGGFEALKPRGRTDIGVSRSLPQDVADLLCHLKEDNPALSVQLLIKRAVGSGKVPAGLPVPPSTVHRLFSRAGLMRAPTAATKDHRRFGFEQANELWMSDVMHGPTVGVGGKIRRKCYLIAFIDDATRVVPFAAFTLSENTSSFLPQLHQAILRRGIPKRLFVDNGSAYRSQHLQLVCAKLGITLIHARPYHPEAKGKQERWFRTVRLQLLPTLTQGDTSSLASLNARLWGWVEGEYHRSPHRGLAKLTPLDAWAERAAHVEHVGGRNDIAQMFLFEQRRKVAKDRTVSLQGTAYEVEAVLVGTAVNLRYDPANCATVQVWGSDGKRYADAKEVDVFNNRFVKRERSSAPQESTMRMRDFGNSEDF
jgi:putative transposase